ncbi:sacsin N-terminal ATP-binding-like domain-containing protein [Candidatus Poriferisodalis sp.]|uniref:sacsin N-terminal ATP-binding-like domain-containing protein n=1 Tax=Candidatus Poriferisodalis sp. TaxID=3101277 RepID=UPI003C703DEA
MQQNLVGDNGPIAQAIEAAEQLFKPGLAAACGSSFEPTGPEEARAAVQRLGELFEELPGFVATAFDGARNSGTLITSDRLQGVAEIVQNADDVEASDVRFLLRPAEVLASHNGTPVRLEHVLGLATPWLSTKADDASAIGRFGVGLSTLQSLSSTLEVHCAPYHVRIGDPTVAPARPPELPSWLCEPGWTTMRIPLQAGTWRSRDLEDWFDGWDDSALLFLRHVARVTLLDPNGDTIRQLELARRTDENLMLGSELPAVSREHASAADGRSWAAYSANVPAPAGVSRANKATASITPIAVAVPFSPTEKGQIYAGLPVASTRSPLFASAQFDPLISRADFADTAWNQVLVNLVAELWSEAVLDLFGRDPQAAWHAIPLPHSREEEPSSPVVRALEAAVIEKARGAVASRLSFSVPEQGNINLSQLALEAKPLEGLLQESETAQLAGLSATLPSGVRDPAGRWRSVLEDWRSYRDDLPEPVSVERALDLVGDENRSASLAIALVAAALAERLGARLLELPCVISHDGRRLVPPTGNSAAAVSVEAAPLAEQLGITTLLHPAHLASTNGAPAVLAWLRECGALLDGSDDGEVVRRLAEAGRSGRPIGSPLSDEQVRALGDALERMTRNERAALGPDVGRAVRLESYIYDAGGHKKTGSARPVDAYLPRSIDRDPDSFAAAAGKSQGLVWLSDRYARTLRSQAGREGIGALRFLRLLGAATAPRLRPHPQLRQPYQNDSRQGLFKRVEGGPEARSSAMTERGADYTLEDHDSPDLFAVIADISRERRGGLRRKRAGALLVALGRGWDRRLSDFAEVDAVEGYYVWRPKGRIRAFWLAQAGDVAWLDDESGTARKPTALRVRTPGTEAIYGANSPDYLHKDLDQPSRRTLLAAVGVSSDPSRSELVERLRALRQASHEDEVSPEDQRHDSALVYRALARSLGAHTDSDLTENQLWAEFARHGLVLTDLGWLSPRNVLAGPPIFGRLRPFAPAIRGCEPLWRALRLRMPSPDDCLNVLREAAFRRQDAPDATEEAILLETMRTLAEHHARGNTVERRKLVKLALWTSIGWRRDRPVYATDDPVLAAGLGDRLPIWRPGGGLEQFQSLLEPLRVTAIRASEAEVIEPEHAANDLYLTELFRRAVELLRDDLQRNDPRLAERCTESWANLEAYVVKVHPSLALAVRVASGQKYDCDVKAKVDTARATVFVTEPAALARVDGGGRALAALFKGGARLVAQAWRAACDQAEEGIEVRSVELARERAARAEAELEAGSHLAEWRKSTAQKHRSLRSPDARPGGKTQSSDVAGKESRQRQQSPPATALRTLVEPQSLMLVDPMGREDNVSLSSASGTGGKAARSGLNEPKRGSRRPQNRIPLRGYSDVDREDVGFELLQMLLGTDQDDIVDLRTQRGVGADAVDQLDKFYELKVSAGSEPDQVTLTDSEVQRALTTPDFFLVVVSNIEGVDAQPTIRVVNDPLNNLRPTERGAITLSGLREATSLVYQFAPIDDQRPISEGENIRNALSP